MRRVGDNEARDDEEYINADRAKPDVVGPWKNNGPPGSLTNLSASCDAKVKDNDEAGRREPNKVNAGDLTVLFQSPLSRSWFDRADG